MPIAECGKLNERLMARAARRGEIFCLLTALAGLIGCGGTFQVRADRTVAQPAEWVVAVFPLDDSGTEATIEEYTIAGRTGAQGSGAMFARGIARAVAASGRSDDAQGRPESDRTGGRFRSVDETAFRKLMLDEKLTLAKLPSLDDRRAGELGRKLGANLVVRGQVAADDNSWLLFMRRATVRLELRGLDPATGETIWTATLGDSSTSRSEAALISKISEDALRAIAEGVGASRTP
jgi:hypothetical protein